MSKYKITHDVPSCVISVDGKPFAIMKIDKAIEFEEGLIFESDGHPGLSAGVWGEKYNYLSLESVEDKIKWRKHPKLKKAKAVEEYVQDNLKDILDDYTEFKLGQAKQNPWVQMMNPVESGLHPVWVGEAPFAEVKGVDNPTEYPKQGGVIRYKLEVNLIKGAKDDEDYKKKLEALNVFINKGFRE